MCVGCSIKHSLLKYVLKLHSNRASIRPHHRPRRRRQVILTHRTQSQPYIVYRGRTSYTIYYTTVPTPVELLNKLAVRVNECLNMCRIHVEGSSAAPASLII